MKKRITALLLAVVMVMCMAAMAGCKDDSNGPAGGGANTGNAGGSPSDTQGAGGAGTDAQTQPAGTTPAETEQQMNEYGVPLEYFENYIPEPDAQYMGKAGYMLKGGAVIDEMRVTKGSRTAMYENTFEESKDIPEGLFTTFGGAVSDWSVNDANQLTYGGSDDSVLTIGNTQWGGGIKEVTKITLAEGSEARIYFCIKDESNCYYVSVTPESSSVHQIDGGTDTVVSELGIKSTVGESFPVTVSVDKDSITIYIDGIDLFYIGDNLTTHTYNGLLGIGQWNTEFYIDDIVVENTSTGEVYYSQDFEDGTFMATVTFGQRNGGTWASPDNSAGDWEVLELEDGNHVLHYKSSTSYGAVVLFDANLPEDCTGYKFSYKGYKVTGSEGYACVWDWDPTTVDAGTNVGQNYTCFNLGGWSGQAGFQTIVGGTKTNIQNNADVGLLTGEWQQVELYMQPSAVFAFFHGDFVQVHWW